MAKIDRENSSLVLDDGFSLKLNEDEGKLYGDLDALIHHLGGEFNEDYCGQFYWRWEERIATPLLNKANVRVVKFWTGDGDSFGPLVRCVRCVVDDTSIQLCYG